MEEVSGGAQDDAQGREMKESALILSEARRVRVTIRAGLFPAEDSKRVKNGVSPEPETDRAVDAA